MSTHIHTYTMRENCRYPPLTSTRKPQSEHIRSVKANGTTGKKRFSGTGFKDLPTYPLCQKCDGDVRLGRHPKYLLTICLKQKVQPPSTCHFNGACRHPCRVKITAIGTVSCAGADNPAIARGRFHGKQPPPAQR